MLLLIILISILLLMSLYLNYNLFMFRKHQEDELIKIINDSLTILDAQYSNIARVTSQSVMSDSPEIRIVANALVNARESIIDVARILEDIIVDDNLAEVGIKDIQYVGEPSIEIVKQTTTARGAALQRQLSLIDNIGKIK